MRYRWPDGQQCAVVLSFDFDAESGFLFREPEKSKRSLAGLEERRFGPRVGVDRILRMLDQLRLPATFFIPGWTVENHRPQSIRIRDAGHEIGAHGNMHEAVDGFDAAQEEAVMKAQLRILADQLGVRPAGNVIADPARVFDLWSREFAGIYRENGCFVLTCHPFVIGRASRIMLLEELVAYIRGFPGVWFTTGEAIARWHEKQGQPGR